MTESKLKKILAYLPVFEQMPDSNDFRQNPVKVCEFALITQKTSPGMAYYPYKIRRLAAVIGRSPESDYIYFTPDSLVDRKGVTLANSLSCMGSNTHSINTSQIASYERLR